MLSGNPMTESTMRIPCCTTVLPGLRPAGLRLLAAVHPAVGGGAPDPDPVERAAVPTQADGEFRPEKAGGGGSPPLGGGGRQSEKQAGLSDRGGRGISPPHCGPRVRRRERRGRPPDRGGAVGACGIEPEAAGCLSGGDGSFFTDRCDRRLMYADQTF